MTTRRSGLHPAAIAAPAAIIALSLGYMIGGAQHASGPLRVQPTHEMAMEAIPETTPAQAMQAANARMHSSMAMPSSGDVDLDFAKGMIPHHQGAVEMAQVELRHGKDPEMRRLAGQILAAQQPEIDAMKSWIARRK